MLMDASVPPCFQVYGFDFVFWLRLCRAVVKLLVFAHTE
jgi:hypothetical protein